MFTTAFASLLHLTTLCLGTEETSCFRFESKCFHWDFSGLQRGQFSTHTLLLLSHTTVICAECGLELRKKARPSQKKTSDGGIFLI